MEKFKMRQIFVVLGIFISGSVFAAESVKIAPIDSDPSLKGAISRVAHNAGWVVSWEIPSELEILSQSYSGTWPNILQEAADDQLAKRGAYHSLICIETKTLRVVANTVTVCAQPSPPIFQLTVKARGENPPLIIRYFKGEFEDPLTVGGAPWRATNSKVNVKIERVQ